ncbi:MAG: SPFH domain-containing protein, partial [Planctomycetes bacterium]|nr:SPFH domain-containing protein [Planctomycetota bacterium]
MGLWDKIRGELIDIIEWLDDTNDTLVWRFERYGNEIKYGAKLVVRPGQSAVFVSEGQLADVFQPGMYELETRNLPVLSTLLGWKYGFHSPFKAEVYFVSTRRMTDLKWGTRNPIMLRDPEFGPVRLRAFGTYVIRVKDPARLIREIVGTDGQFTLAEITDQLRDLIVTRFSDLLGESRIPVLDLAGNYDELSKFVAKKVADEFAAYGLEVTKLLVENISLPPAVEEALDKRSSMGVIGDLGAYAQYEAATAMESAAENPSGTAAAGVGMGMGFAMANQMGRVIAGGSQQGANAAPPPIAPAVQYYLAVAGRQVGPFDLDGLRGELAGGRLSRQTPVWRQGMAQWTPAEKVPELAG